MLGGKSNMQFSSPGYVSSSVARIVHDTTSSDMQTRMRGLERRLMELEQALTRLLAVQVQAAEPVRSPRSTVTRAALYNEANADNYAALRGGDSATVTGDRH